MFSIRAIIPIIASISLATTAGATTETNAAVATTAVYVPDTTHANEPLRDGVLAWNSLLQSVDATNEQEVAHFTFTFTNIAKKIELGQATNVITLTNFTTITNSGFWKRLFEGKTAQVASTVQRTNVVTITNAITPIPVTILNVHPSCGCTTAELPPVPWTIPGGGTGEIKLNVNLEGKTGTLFKQVTVSSDQGTKSLMLRINILPPPPMPQMTEAQRAAAMQMAKVDRQAVFKGDCASCHVKKVEGKYGQQLYEAVCTICHEAEHRASMVPDLHNLQVATNEEFWRTWITSGKAGSLMPAFATSQGGPLSDLQIASLAAYLHSINPSHVPPPAK